MNNFQTLNSSGLYDLADSDTNFDQYSAFKNTL